MSKIRKNTIGKIAGAMAVVLCIVVFSPATAFSAQPAPMSPCSVTPPPVPNPNAATLANPCTCNVPSITNVGVGQVISCCQNLPNSVFYYADNCIESMVVASAGGQLANVINGFSGVVVTVLIIAMVLFGYRLLTGAVGERELKKESALMLFKMVAIIGILGIPAASGTPFAVTIMNGITGLSSGLSSIIISAVTPGSTVPSIWIVVDTTLETVLGMAITFTGGAVIIGILTVVLFTGPLGIGLGILIITMIFVFIYALALTLFIQLSSVIGAAFLAMFAPLFLPLILFQHSIVRGLFDKWFKLFINYSLQPVILVAYLSLMIVVISGFATTLSTLLLQKAPTTTCPLFSLFSSASTATAAPDTITIPCFDTAAMARFSPPLTVWGLLMQVGIQVISLAILAVSMVKFLKETLPDIMQRLAGSVGNAATPWGGAQEMLAGRDGSGGLLGDASDGAKGGMQKLQGGAQKLLGRKR